MREALFARVELGPAEVARIGAVKDVIVGAAEDPGLADELDLVGFVAGFLAQFADRGLHVGFSRMERASGELDHALSGAVAILLDDEDLAVAFADDDRGIGAFAGVVVDLAAVGKTDAVLYDLEVGVLVYDC